MFNFFNKEKKAHSIEAFTFGDASEVLDTSDLLTYFLINYNGKYYEPPINLSNIYKSQYANTHHSSAMQLKVKLLCSLFKPSKYLNFIEFKKFANNQIVFGNAYLEEIPSRGSKPIGYHNVPAMNTRRADENKYLFLDDKLETHELGKIIHVMDDDLRQELYGKPYYMAALEPAWLNHEATLFRRKYYKNGNHAGFILYLSDPAHSTEDVTALKTALKNSKGPGAFRNLFFYSPKGKKDGMQVIPVESAQAQDKFFDIKNVSRGDVMSMHRIPPNMMSVESPNAGGFGNILEAREAMMLNEILPWAKILAETHPIFTFNGI